MGCLCSKEAEDPPSSGSARVELSSSSNNKEVDHAQIKLSKKLEAGLVRQVGEGGVIEGVMDKGGVLFDKKDNSDCCRECGNAFNISSAPVKALVKLERHHCRSCGGVFCDKCTQYELQLPGSLDTVRCCPGCWRGEIPGVPLKEKISQILEIRGEQKGSPLKPSCALALERGAKYDNIPPTDVPLSGYLEFINKSQDGGINSSVCCVKVMYGGGDTKFEVPRPSYFAVPPGEVVHCSFPPSTPSLEIIVLFGNSSPGMAHVFDTRAKDVSVDKISNSAKVSLFKYAAAYRVNCKGKNVLLKYKGDGVVGVRAGNSVARIGLKAKMTRKKRRTSQLDGLDYATNVTEIEKLFQY